MKLRWVLFVVFCIKIWSVHECPDFVKKKKKRLRDIRPCPSQFSCSCVFGSVQWPEQKWTSSFCIALRKCSTLQAAAVRVGYVGIGPTLPPHTRSSLLLWLCPSSPLSLFFILPLLSANQLHWTLMTKSIKGRRREAQSSWRNAHIWNRCPFDLYLLPLTYTTGSCLF